MGSIITVMYVIIYYINKHYTIRISFHQECNDYVYIQTTMLLTGIHVHIHVHTLMYVRMCLYPHSLAASEVGMAEEDEEESSQLLCLKVLVGGSITQTYLIGCHWSFVFVMKVCIVIKSMCQRHLCTNLLAVLRSRDVQCT